MSRLLRERQFAEGDGVVDYLGVAIESILKQHACVKSSHGGACDMKGLWLDVM